MEKPTSLAEGVVGILIMPEKKCVQVVVLEKQQKGESIPGRIPSPSVNYIYPAFNFSLVCGGAGVVKRARKQLLLGQA